MKKYYNEYMEAVKNPKIVHYAACVKPWLYPDSFLSEYFFKYARMTPFYEKIIEARFKFVLDLEKNEIYKELQKNNNTFILYLTKFKQIKYRYFKYRILSSLTFGKLKEKYKEKRIKNKELYTYLKKIWNFKSKRGNKMNLFYNRWGRVYWFNVM
ncbi:MAG: hypothetical protein L6V95_02015 [Candidatus Melainabacteria bacterium]|nr:MAG: hypothetical protein L6V95_02015 [Candidatus Melainabacteria bacterium]